MATTFGVGSLAGIFTAAAAGEPMSFKFRTETSSRRVVGNKGRAAFYVTFALATAIYLDKRIIASHKEAADFTDATNSFFDKITQCREKNPFDILVSLTPDENQVREFLESMTHPPNTSNILFQNQFKK